MEQTKKGMVIVIVLLSVLVVGLSSYIVYDKFVKNDMDVNSSLSDEDLENDDTNKSESNSDTENLEQDDNNWTDYLLSLHLLDAKISRIRSKNLGDSDDLNKKVTISMDELKQLLSKLENNKLLKTYSQGRGGPDRDHLTVAYEQNDQTYEFEIFGGAISVDKLDQNFKDFLETAGYEEANLEYKDLQGSFYYYDIEGYAETIFDEYFD